MAKEKYYSLSLYAERDGKPCTINRLPQVLQDKSNPAKLNDLQIVGIDSGSGLVEFFSELPVADCPCTGLSYVTKQQIDRGAFLKATKGLTDEDICRALERVHSICASRQKNGNHK